MNCLNSCVVEGKVSRGLDEDGVFVFQTTCSVKDAENGKVNEEVSEIQCRTFGKIRESVEKNAKLWRTVRVVGRLAHFKGKLALVAEMVEFAPMGKGGVGI